MKVYISGPITGHDTYRDDFHQAEKQLNDRGILTGNPAANDLGDNATWLDYMRYDLAQLLACDAIYMLPGWAKSRGATIEHDLARSLGLPIIEGSAGE